MLDRLAQCITPEDEEKARQAAMDRGRPRYSRELHNHVAGLLVKYGVTTWHHLRTHFPSAGHHPCLPYAYLTLGYLGETIILGNAKPLGSDCPWHWVRTIQYTNNNILIIGSLAVLRMLI